MAVLTRLSVKTTGATLRDKALLPHDSLKASVAPQAIGWISTISAAGVAHVVPYSFFHKLSWDPWIPGFPATRRRIWMRNIVETGEFAFNLPTVSQIDDADRSSVPAAPEIDEFAVLGMDSAKSHKVKP